MLTVHVLKTCDTCRKALKALDSEGVSYRSSDVRADGLKEADLERWASLAGWETLVNRSSTTWRSLGDKEKAIASAEDAIALLVRSPTLLKRPVFDFSDVLVVGFRPVDQARVLELANKKTPG